MSSSFTPNLAMELPVFDVSTWHDAVNNNFSIIDAVLGGTSVFVSSAWQNSHVYAVNDLALDIATFTFYRALVAHTSGAAGTFASARAINPTYWDPMVVGSFQLYSADAGATAGPSLNLYRDSLTPAISDAIGAINFSGKDSGAGVEIYANLSGVINDPAAGSEDGSITVFVKTAGSFTAACTFVGSRIFLDGGQLKFPPTQNASSDANTLDDYEEGTFTPTVAGTTAAGVGTYSLQSGQYTKEGNVVNFTVSLAWSAHTGTGNIEVRALPFTCGTLGTAVAFSASSFTYTGTLLMASTIASTASIGFYQTTTGAGLSAIAMDVAANLTVSGMYFV